MRKSIITVPLKRYRKFGYQNSKKSKITWVVIVKRWYYSYVLE